MTVQAHPQYGATQFAGVLSAQYSSVAAHQKPAG